MVHSSPHATARGPQGIRLELTLALVTLLSVVAAIPTIGAVTGTASPSAQIVVPSDVTGHKT